MDKKEARIVLAIAVMLIALAFTAFFALREDAQWRADCLNSGGIPFAPKGEKRVCLDPKSIKP